MSQKDLKLPVFGQFAEPVESAVLGDAILEAFDKMYFTLRGEDQDLNMMIDDNCERAQRAVSEAFVVNGLYFFDEYGNPLKEFEASKVFLQVCNAAFLYTNGESGEDFQDRIRHYMFTDMSTAKKHENSVVAGFGIRIEPPYTLNSILQFEPV